MTRFIEDRKRGSGKNFQGRNKKIACVQYRFNVLEINGSIEKFLEMFIDSEIDRYNIFSIGRRSKYERDMKIMDDTI